MATPGQDEYTDWMQAAADAGHTRAGTPGVVLALAILAVMLAFLA